MLMVVSLIDIAVRSNSQPAGLVCWTTMGRVLVVIAVETSNLAHAWAYVSKTEKCAKLTREINLKVSQVSNFYTCASFSVVLQPKLGLGCLTVEVSRSHIIIHRHPVGLHWAFLLITAQQTLGQLIIEESWSHSVKTRHTR